MRFTHFFAFLCMRFALTLLCRPMQNKNVKYPNSRYYGECEHATVNFPFYSGPRQFGQIGQIERVGIIEK